MPGKRLSDFRDYSKEKLIQIVKDEAGKDASRSLIIVAKRILDIPEYSCLTSIPKDGNVEDFIKKWVAKFIKGYKNRPSQRASNPIGTQPDPIVDAIISARIQSTPKDLEVIKYGHRLSMSVENIAGAFLEEYISSELIQYDWHCCWGETMKSIDFCNLNGQLLQVKNSENSSSKTVRDGTDIK